MTYTKLSDELGISQIWQEFENYVLTSQAQPADFLLIDVAPKMFDMLVRLDQAYEKYMENPNGKGTWSILDYTHSEVRAFISRLKIKLADWYQ